jgi:uncharacterized protein (TIGR00661 family)
MAKFLFIVQGEGKGHLTQAISLTQILEKNNHTIVATMVGTTKNRAIPTFYTTAMPMPLVAMDSPSLFYGKGKGPSLFRTVFSQIIKAKHYLKNADLVNETVLKYQPDIIINFYEMAAGFYNFFYRPSIPTICIGHQYLLLHKQFLSINKKAFERFLLNLNTKITALGSAQKMALSFYPLPNDEHEKIVVVPPLLRCEVKEAHISTQNYLLAYVTHHKIIEDIFAWHQNNSHETIHCFTDKKNLDSGAEISPNFYIHKINPAHFLEKMASCKGLVTTAGFESVCEAMYMGKPVLMVPVKNHIEQRVNAHDGQRTGAGIYNKTFKIGKFLKYIDGHHDISERFQIWESHAEALLLHNISEVLDFATQNIKTERTPRQNSKNKLTLLDLIKEVMFKKKAALGIG